MASRKTNVFNQLLALGALYNEQVHPCGTAFLIGSGVALSAAHVLAQPFDRRVRVIAASETHHDFTMVAQQIVDRRSDTLLWGVVSAHQVPSLSDRPDRPIDICVLQLKRGARHPELEDHRRWFFELNVATPSVGSHVTAFGFAESRIERDPDAPLTFNCRHAFRKIEGTITRLFIPKRDNVGLPFPSFEVAADFEPGMSGGPIFNDRNQVVGVITRGGIPGVSYGTVLWPALSIEIDGQYLLDLARSGRIRARNAHCVQLHHSSDARFPGVSFDPRHEIP